MGRGLLHLAVLPGWCWYGRPASHTRAESGQGGCKLLGLHCRVREDAGESGAGLNQGETSAWGQRAQDPLRVSALCRSAMLYFLTIANHPSSADSKQPPATALPSARPLPPSPTCLHHAPPSLGPGCVPGPGADRCRARARAVGVSGAASRRPPPGYGRTDLSHARRPSCHSSLPDTACLASGPMAGRSRLWRASLYLSRAYVGCTPQLVVGLVRCHARPAHDGVQPSSCCLVNRIVMEVLLFPPSFLTPPCQRFAVLATGCTCPTTKALSSLHTQPRPAWCVGKAEGRMTGHQPTGEGRRSRSRPSS